MYNFWITKYYYETIQEQKIKKIDTDNYKQIDMPSKYSLIGYWCLISAQYTIKYWNGKNIIFKIYFFKINAKNSFRRHFRKQCDLICIFCFYSLSTLWEFLNFFENNNEESIFVLLDIPFDRCIYQFLCA